MNLISYDIDLCNDIFLLILTKWAQGAFGFERRLNNWTEELVKENEIWPWLFKINTTQMYEKLYKLELMFSF